jgi:hypothetical protein
MTEFGSNRGMKKMGRGSSAGSYGASVRGGAIVLMALTVLVCALPASASASFGLKKGGVKVVIAGPGDATFTQAGGHPASIFTEFNLKTVPNPVPDENFGLPISDESPLRNATVEVPAGLLGDPTAAPRCSLAELVADGTTKTECPDSSQIGVAVNEFNLNGQHEPLRSALYNLDPEPGQPALFGFKAFLAVIILVPRLRSDGDYGFDVVAKNIDQSVPVTTSKVTFWGVPASSEHDSERGNLEAGECADGSAGPPCPSDAPLRPFLRLPTDCSAGPLPFGIEVESWSERTHFASTLASDPEGKPVEVTHCERVPFEPSIAGGITTDNAGTASGLDFSMSLPEGGIKNPDGVGQADLRKAVVELPEGVTLNPSAGEGLGACSLAQHESEEVNTPPGAGCPNASKLGTVSIETPLLEKGELVSGSLFLAQPDDPTTSAPGAENPFDSLLATYLVIRSQERGVIVKMAGRIDTDPLTGQITTTFDNLPQLPFTNFHLHLREGARAPLVSSSTCGPEVTTARLVPWSASSPDEAAEVHSTVLITRGVGGGPCPKGDLPPFRPSLLAGTLNNAAGQYSPFYLRLLRSDEEQEITHFSIKLPPGVVGKLAGIPFCPEAAIAVAEGREQLGGGKEEQASPACPAASEVGRTLVGAGVGSTLTYVPGKVYLAGPYNGSALSVVAVTSGVVGPFDVGTIVVREALKINPETAEVFIDATGSDPIPHIVDGIATHIRDLRIYVDRPDFVLNPTSCARTSTASTVLGSGLDFVSTLDDNPITVTSPFQAADCAHLGFAPKLALSLKGATRRGGTPALKAVLKARPGDANIGAAQVTLPHSEFLEQAHIGTVCTRVQFKEGGGNGEKCPPASVYGRAEAITPLLDEPLAGPVFLRSSNHPLPDLVASLNSGKIDIALVGRIDSVKGRIRSTFEAVPDAPVTRFTLQMRGGKKSLFVNSTNLCRKTHRAKSHFTGQNGKVYDTRPILKAKCAKKPKKRTSSSKHRRR